MKKMLVVVMASAFSMLASFALASQIPEMEQIEIKLKSSQWQECHNLYFDFDKKVAYCLPSEEMLLHIASREEVVEKFSPIPLSKIQKYILTTEEKYFFYKTSEAEDVYNTLQDARRIAADKEAEYRKCRGRYTRACEKRCHHDINGRPADEYVMSPVIEEYYRKHRRCTSYCLIDVCDAD